MAKRSMTIQERIDDISRRSGVSEAIVRSVLKSLADSTVASIRNGENAVIPNVGKIRPIFKRKVTKDGDTKSVLDVKIEPLFSYSSRLEDVITMKRPVEVEEQELGIRTVQIESLM